jgi:hypothetical protein
MRWPRRWMCETGAARDCQPIPERAAGVGQDGTQPPQSWVPVCRLLVRALLGRPFRTFRDGRLHPTAAACRRSGVQHLTGPRGRRAVSLLCEGLPSLCISLGGCGGRHLRRVLARCRCGGDGEVPGHLEADRPREGRGGGPGRGARLGAPRDLHRRHVRGEAGRREHPDQGDVQGRSDPGAQGTGPHRHLRGTRGRRSWPSTPWRGTALPSAPPMPVRSGQRSSGRGRGRTSASAGARCADAAGRGPASRWRRPAVRWHPPLPVAASAQERRSRCRVPLTARTGLSRRSSGALLRPSA